MMKDENQISNIFNFYKEVFSNSSIGMAVTDMSGQCIDVNNTMCRVVGGTREQILAQNFNHIESWKKTGLLDAALAVIREKKEKHHEVTLTTSFDRTVTIDYHIIPFTAEEQSYLLFIFNDISAKKQAEDEKERLETELRQAHKMEAIGTLAGGIAHDFNNILASIIGYADMAQDDIPDWSPAKYQIEEVLKAGNRAKDLVRQILAFSRKTEQRRVPVQIHLLIKEVYSFLRATIPTTIEIKLNIDSHCGYILADPTQIHQTLLNLCTNAAHAMEDKGGVLTIDLKTVDLASEVQKNDAKVNTETQILLSVSDTGIGIEKEQLLRIFDPYYTTREVGKGSGMGLAIVHGIVLSHEGKVQVESIPGEGTTFKLFFPRVEAEAEMKAVENTALPTGKEKVLIVDDDASIANLNKRILAKLGYQTTVKTSSTETLELFRSDPDAYDLVITDQTMPGMAGDQLAREMLKVRSDTPIIMCTGYSSGIDAEKADAIGLRAFIMKPIDRKELAITVRKVLDFS